MKLSSGEAARRARSRAFAGGLRWLLLLPGGVLAAACTYDPDDRCGPDQVVYNDTRCVCGEGTSWTPQGCLPCGEHEVSAPAGCSCADGFTRAAPGAACEAVPGGLGVACDSVSAPCTDATFAYCQITSGTQGYCTSEGCTAAEPCAGSYACNTEGATPFCQRPPLGLGTTCQSPADCAGTEATFCDAFMTHQCLVQGCSLEAQDCFGGMQCCDFSQYGLPTLCAPAGSC